MSLLRSQDSLSRCQEDSYANLYDLHKPSLRKEQSALLRAPSRDVLEISRAKLEQEALKSLRHHTDVTVAQHSFMRVGKYLFLAVALPPIFVLYKIPKWIVITALPLFFTPFVQMWEIVKKVANQQWQKQVSYFVKISETLQTIWHSILLPITHVFSQLQLQWQQLKKHFTSMKKFLESSLSRTTLFYKPFNAIKEQVFKLTSRFATTVQGMALQGAHFIASTLNTWKQRALPLMQKKPTRFLQFTLRDASIKAQRGADYVVAFLKKGSFLFKQDISPLLSLLAWIWRFIMGCFLFIQEKLGWCLEKSSVVLTRSYQSALLLLQKRLDKVKTMNCEVNIRRFLENLIDHKWIKHIPCISVDKIKRILLQEVLLKYAAAIVRLGDFFLNCLLRGFIVVYEGVVKCKKLVAPVLKYTKFTVKKADCMSRKAISYSFKGVAVFGYSLLYYFLLLCVISWMVSAQKSNAQDVLK